MNKQLQIDSLQSGLPRPVIEAAFVIMVLSAICTYGPVNTWMSSHIPVVAGLVHTVGMVVIYYAFLRGMKGLPHPLTVLWWIAIGLNLCDFVILCLGESMAGLSAATATALPLIYIPLGAFLLVWYRGRLGNAGFWMIVRILVVNLVPVLFYVTGLLESAWGLAVMEMITISVEIWFAWTLRRVLV
ncbi:MAG: hypothetical protein IJP49_02590 [Bacteroidales bacterium]|nr:hypothetical protein [Bacteroidales bacterium]